MDILWSDDVDDSIYTDDLREDSEDRFDKKSNDGNQSLSYGSESEQSSKIGRKSRLDSRSDVSVLSRSDRSKSYSRSSNDRETVSGSALRETELLHLLSDSGFPMTQVNGQRKLGPPPGWNKPPPDPSCEVFVGKIPRTLYEYEIYPIFLKIGEVYELRLMMDFSGTNRGYCFVMFTKFEYAERAVKELNNYEIRPGRRIGVVASINNCRLCIGQIPADVESENIIQKFYEMTDEVSKVSIYKNINGQIRCALVSYKTHRGAAMARRRLLPERGNLFPPAEVTIDWAHPDMSPSNVVEETGVRDEDGKVQINKVKIAQAPKRGGSHRRGRHDFLDKSIKNYLKDKPNSQNYCQRKPVELPSVRMQKSLASGNFCPSRRRSGRGFSQSRKYFNPQSRGRGINRDKIDNHEHNQSRSRSLPAPPNDNYSYPSSRDINGNITQTKNSQQVRTDFPEVDCVANDSSGKISNDAPIGKSVGTVNPQAKIFVPAKSSFNLFEQYPLNAERQVSSTVMGNDYNPMQSSIGWGGSVPNFFRKIEPRSDGEIRKNQNHCLNVQEKAANFAEFGKWNSTESFVPTAAVSVAMQQKDNYQRRKAVNDVPSSINIDSSKATTHNLQKKFNNDPVIGNHSKNAPQVSNQITKWNGNFKANPEVSQHSHDSGNVQTNFATKGNLINCYSTSGPDPSVSYVQGRSENCCQQCFNHFAMIKRQMQFHKGFALPQQQIVPYNPVNYWRALNGVAENTASVVDRNTSSTNFAPQGFFPTSAFADYYHGAISQIYTGNKQQIACRPRPILNRFAGRVNND